jgi:hypothetical protein
LQDFQSARQRRNEEEEPECKDQIKSKQLSAFQPVGNIIAGDDDGCKDSDPQTNDLKEIDPTMEAFTISSWPDRRRAKRRIRTSVDSARMDANGTMPIIERIKTSSEPKDSAQARIASGMKIRR